MGDARRLLDICKSVLQNVYSDGIIKEGVVVRVPDMSRTLSQFFRSGGDSRIHDLPRLVQVLLACLCSILKEMESRMKNPKFKNQSKSISGVMLRAVYMQVQKQLLGGTRPSVTEFGVLFDQLVHNGFCKVVQSKRLKPADRPVSYCSRRLWRCRFWC